MAYFGSFGTPKEAHKSVNTYPNIGIFGGVFWTSFGAIFEFILRRKLLLTKGTNKWTIVGTLFLRLNEV